MASKPQPLRADAQEIARTVDLLFGPVDVVEVRVPNTGREGTVSGYFQDHAALAKCLAARNGDPAVYVTLNPVVPALLARCANRLKSRAKTTTSDHDIAARHWLLIDCDPVRPAEISSTDAEHEAALARARDIRMVLAEEGWPAPILTDSGNGGHLLYCIDLPNDEASAKLLAGVLKALAARFNDAAVKVDETVFNAARIVKAYGTVARKGDDTPDRPHRLSRILDVPAALKPVPRQLLEEVAGPAAPPKDARTRAGASVASQFDLEGFLGRHLQARAPVAHEGGRKWVLETCPFNGEHKAPDAAVFEHADGSIGFKCFHNSCSGYGWRDVREKFEPRAERRQSTRKPKSRPLAPAAAMIDLNRFEPSLELLNSLIVWQGRIEFLSVKRKGPMLIATTTNDVEIVWPSTAELNQFTKSQTVIADATNILIPTPPQREIRKRWEEAASLLLKLAAHDDIRLEPALKEEIRDLLRLVWRAAGQPQAADSRQFIEFVRAVLRTRRNPTGAIPPCVFIAEEAVWVHVPSLRLWASIPAVTNKQPALADVRNGLLLLGFTYHENLSRGFEGDAETVCLWRGPLEVLEG
jgi:hypothetical protein